LSWVALFPKRSALTYLEGSPRARFSAQPRWKGSPIDGHF